MAFTFQHTREKCCGEFRRSHLSPREVAQACAAGQAILVKAYIWVAALEPFLSLIPSPKSRPVSFTPSFSSHDCGCNGESMLDYTFVVL